MSMLQGQPHGDDVSDDLVPRRRTALGPLLGLALAGGTSTAGHATAGGEEPGQAVTTFSLAPKAVVRGIAQLITFGD